ncbi:MAG: MarR family transcriptional regulator [Azospirillum brasilense]|nr:MAG: MarR family transcriptional regulator [Azospirillum brasilense]
MPIGSMYEMPGHLIRRAHQISGAIFTARLAGFDITSVQYAAMVAIASQPGIDGGVLDRLEAKGLIARQPSRQDRRIKTIALTSDGSALLDTVKDSVLAAQAEMLQPLSETERAQFIALLKKFVGRPSEED